MSSSAPQAVPAVPAFRNLLRAVQQIKWAEANAAELALRRKLMDTKATSIKQAHALYGVMWGQSELKREVLVAAARNLTELNSKAIAVEHGAYLIANHENLVASIEQLKLATLQDKRTVLRAVPTIGVSLAAAYLGVTAAALSEFTENCEGLFGGNQRGTFLLSIDEIFMIARHPQWIASIANDAETETNHDTDDYVFDRLVSVDTATACAFLNLTPSELERTLHSTPQARRQYRLADLEKIRVQKLAQQLN